MGQGELGYFSAVDLAAAIRQKRLSPVEVVDAILERIERVNPRLNAFCAVPHEAARQAARAAEGAVMRGQPLGPLHGVPFSVKDLVLTRGVRTTFGSRIFADHIPQEDAPAVARLASAGGILVGKTTSPEFGWKGTTDSPLLGISRNPWNLACSPGGSSGGAAAAVAAGLGPLAVGTDGGGSIRIPGSFCGVFGLKPTCGRVPTYPPSPSGSLSHVGPMTWTVADAALMLRVMAGPDPRDPLSLSLGDPPPAELPAGGLSGLTIAWSPTLGYADPDPEVRDLAGAAARRLAGLGCAVEEVERVFADPDPVWAVHFYAGLALRLRPYLPAWRDRLDPGLAEVAAEAARLDEAEVARAGLAREAFGQTVRRFFEGYDLLLTPTLPVTAFPAGSERPALSPPGSRLRWVAYTYPFNLTGQPAATVPCGFTRAGLPVGVQLVGRRGEDGTVLRAAAALEAAAPWAGRRPALPDGPPGGATGG